VKKMMNKWMRRLAGGNKKTSTPVLLRSKDISIFRVNLVDRLPKK